MTVCPYCGHRFDRHTGEVGTQPKDGDVSVCWKCGAAGIFTFVNGALAIREPTENESQMIAGSKRVRQVQAAIRESYEPMEAAAMVFGETETKTL